MSLREVLNRFPAITTAMTLVVIMVAVGFIIFSQLPSRKPTPATKAFYSSDDGKTWFADDIKKLAPFAVEGKDAVLVHVFKCPKGEPFVAYMERYTPEARLEMEKIMIGGKDVMAMEMGEKLVMLRQSGVEYKKPGDAKWFKMEDDYGEFARIMTIKCPEGGEIPEPVVPTEK